MKGFATSSEYLNIPCPKPINSVPISDDVTNFDNVKVEDCDEKSDDENEKIEKQKLFLELKEKFKNTVLRSTEIGECSKQKPVKKIVEQKQIVKKPKNVQNKNKSSSVRSSNRDKKPQKLENQNSQKVLAISGAGRTTMLKSQIQQSRGKRSITKPNSVLI